MSEDILVMKVQDLDAGYIDTSIISKEQAVATILALRDEGIDLAPVSMGYRAVFVGTQAEPEVYTDFLDWEAVVALTGGAL